MKKLIFALSTAFLLIFSTSSLFAADKGEPEKFNPGPFIVEHVIDDYGWHITGSGDKSVSIPLPVILFDKGKPVVFMSSKFHHGHNAYKGYALGFTPDTKRSIVKLKGTGARCRISRRPEVVLRNSCK